jgi:hypothetical protein
VYGYGFVGYGRRICAIVAVDVIFDYGLEFFGDTLAFEGHGFLSINVNWGDRDFTCARQANADIGVFGFTWAIDYATHDGNMHGFYTWILVTPGRHLITQIALYVLG